MISARASSVAPRTVAFSAFGVSSRSTRSSSAADSRNCDSLAEVSEPSAANCAAPRTATPPASTAIDVAAAPPSASGLSVKVALPGLPAAFSGPVCGLSIATRVRSISTSALAFDSGALRRTGVGPLSSAASGPASLARVAPSSVSASVTAPSSLGPLATSIATGVPKSWPWPLTLMALDWASTASEACSNRSLARKLIDAQIGERTLGAELLVLWPDALAELEVDRQIAVELAFDQSGIEREASVMLERVAAEQIDQRVGAALQVGARLGRHDRRWRGVGNEVGDIGRPGCGGTARARPRRSWRWRRTLGR